MSQVGFSIQADVIGGGSLLHAATGRLLKALSDGGVDFYAVAAAVQLGKMIPIQSAHESSVSRLLQERGGRSGFIAKALKVGWGHSDIAIEMARTRAGTSALLTINALATGASAYTAAQALAALLTMSGCEPDMLPNVDVLKNMIAYLAPFLAESGFGKVFEHITSNSRRSLMLQSLKGPELAILDHRLTAAGEAEEWAKAVRQLILTAERKESLYLLVMQRGSWLAAYASHVLGMAVKLLSRGKILWEGAGIQGLATFEIDQESQQSGPHLVKSEGFFILDRPHTQIGGQPLSTDYLLSEALSKELSLLPDLSDQNSRAIQTAIVRYAGTLQESLTIDTATECGFEGRSGVSLANGIAHPPNGTFGIATTRLRSVCNDLGLSEVAIQDGQAWLKMKARSRFNSSWDKGKFEGVDYIGLGDRKNFNSWASRKTLHDHVMKLIGSFGMTVFALLPCVYDPHQLRVSTAVINGKDTITSWAPKSWIRSHSYVEFLSHLFHGVGNVVLAENSTYLAISANSTTIYYRALFDEECFDSQGRTLEICSGRITLHGAQRKLVVADHFSLPGDRDGGGNLTTSTLLQEIGVTRIARDVGILPHYIDIPVHAEMETRLEEHSIVVSTRLMFTEGSTISIDLHSCIHNLLLCVVARDCGHDSMTPLVATSENLEVATFLSHGIYESEDPFSTTQAENKNIRLFALKDGRFKQLLQMQFFRADIHGIITLQGESCLSCAIKQARRAAEERKEDSRKKQFDTQSWMAHATEEDTVPEIRRKEQPIIVVMT